MPIPIRPNGITTHEDIINEDSQGYGNLDLNLFQGNLGLATIIQGFGFMEKRISDSDAELIFSLWQGSDIRKNATALADRVYEIPESFDLSKILRLKTQGFLVRKDQGVSFTELAGDVIKDMVLAEQNSFTKESDTRSYNTKAAENKQARRTSNLTHTSSINSLWEMVLEKESEETVIRVEKNAEGFTATASFDSGSSVLQDTGSLQSALNKAKHYALNSIKNGSQLKTQSTSLDKTAMSSSSNLNNIPNSAYPMVDSEYVYNRRFVNKSGNSNKEYNVRIYKNEEGGYDVWGWNGKVNGSLTPQKKGRFDTRDEAKEVAIKVIGTKLAGGYRPAFDYDLAASNSSLPGVAADPNLPALSVQHLNKKEAPVEAPEAPVEKLVSITQEDDISSLIDMMMDKNNF